MTDQALEQELRVLIVDALALEDVTPEEIGFDQTLFGEGLGLDSIDALELAMAISERYQVEFDEENEKNREIFRSVQTLASHIREHRPSGGDGP